MPRGVLSGRKNKVPDNLRAGPGPKEMQVVLKKFNYPSKNTIFFAAISTLDEVSLWSDEQVLRRWIAVYPPSALDFVNGSQPISRR